MARKSFLYKNSINIEYKIAQKEDEMHWQKQILFVIFDKKCYLYVKYQGKIEEIVTIFYCSKKYKFFYFLLFYKKICIYYTKNIYKN